MYCLLFVKSVYFILWHGCRKNQEKSIKVQFVPGKITQYLLQMSEYPKPPGGFPFPPPGMSYEEYQAYWANIGSINSIHSYDYFHQTGHSSQYSYPDMHHQSYYSHPDIYRPFYPPPPPPPASFNYEDPSMQAGFTSQNIAQQVSYSEAGGRKKKERNYEKEIQSAKKNSESNIVNHFFSFFNSREKSEKTVAGSLATFHKDQSEKQKLIHLFYNTIHVLSTRRGRKYVNRNNLMNLIDPNKLVKTIPEIEEKIEKISGVTIEELCKVFRKCCRSFLQTYSIDSILTSKRISVVAREEHLKKRRRVRRVIEKG